MFTPTSHRAVRAAAAFPRLLNRTLCLVVPPTSSINGMASSSCCCSPASPLFSGVSTRSFSTSSLCFASALQPSVFRLQRGFSATTWHSVRYYHQQLLRLHGTVTAFKHRRGYGFVLAEGVVSNSHKPVYTSLEALNQRSTITGNDAAANANSEDESAAAHGDMLHKTYFFTRGSLDGGFYVTEGERVSFVVLGVEPSQGTKRYLGAPAYNTAVGSFGATAAALAEEFSLDHAEVDASMKEEGAALPHRFRADTMRLYDLRTRMESPITPITLYGRVVEWDDVKEQGVIAELDVKREYHEDAPRFPVSMADMDLGPGTAMRVGRFVRFCLGPSSTHQTGSGSEAEGEEEDIEGAAVTADPIPSAATTVTTGEAAGQLVAQRVIVDLALERRRGTVGRPLVPATAVPGTVTDQTRFTGIVREIRGNKFGFIIDDLSGESIFFHASNARANVMEGDRVSYLLREIIRGKHTGKKACYDVRRVVQDGAVPRREHFLNAPECVAPAVAKAEEEEEEIDLLEEEMTATAAATAVGNGGRRYASTSGAAKKKRADATAPKAGELDFDLL